VAQILVDSQCYAEAHHICHLHGVISNMLGGDQCSICNVLAFIIAVGLLRQSNRYIFTLF
jgi:hypothetical protein